VDGKLSRHKDINIKLIVGKLKLYSTLLMGSYILVIGKIRCKPKIPMAFYTVYVGTAIMLKK